MIKFDNAAEAAGLAAQVAAFDGDGAAMARNMLLGKLAPSFRTILGNSEGPLMDLFSQFTRQPDKPRSNSVAGPAARPGASPASTTPHTVTPTTPIGQARHHRQPARLPVATSEENKP